MKQSSLMAMAKFKKKYVCTVQIKKFLSSTAYSGRKAHISINLYISESQPTNKHDKEKVKIASTRTGNPPKGIL
jgi:hypothetical protein